MYLDKRFTISIDENLQNDEFVLTKYNISQFESTVRLRSTSLRNLESEISQQLRLLVKNGNQFWRPKKVRNRFKTKVGFKIGANYCEFKKNKKIFFFIFIIYGVLGRISFYFGNQLDFMIYYPNPNLGEINWREEIKTHIKLLAELIIFLFIIEWGVEFFIRW